LDNGILNPKIDAVHVDFQPPVYGQAAAIYSLFQAGLVPSGDSGKPPNRPRRGKLARWFDSVISSIAVPIPRVPVPIPVRVRA
jgi:hypothetical protein